MPRGRQGPYKTPFGSVSQMMSDSASVCFRGRESREIPIRGGRVVARRWCWLRMSGKRRARDYGTGHRSQSYSSPLYNYLPPPPPMGLKPFPEPPPPSNQCDSLYTSPALPSTIDSILYSSLLPDSFPQTYTNRAAKTPGSRARKSPAASSHGPAKEKPIYTWAPME
ncbi:hypothetical protein CRENBAI_025903 [Crenichthys baileyi]|uniref:Uncharacterized protein n=1 Tax=Crenichthys baileyi TaxID=28760 RepID=A0AAV9S5S4_9TELE